MGDQKATGLGPCGACYKPINQMTPIGHVFRGKPLRSYPAHKVCADKENEPEETLEVSMPVKEQARRGRPAKN